MLSKVTRSILASVNKQPHIRYSTTINRSKKIAEYESKLVVDCQNIVGECPIWDFRRELLCWIDIEGKKFWTYNPINEVSECYELPERPGSFALCDNNKFDQDTYLIAFENGPCFWNISSSKMIGDKIFEFEPDKKSRTNDGRVDKQGRFVFGGMDDPFDPFQPRSESGVYRINKDLSYQRILDDNVSCTNSICFSNDGKTMYFTDTFGAYDNPSILKYDYFEDDRKPNNGQIFCCFKEDAPCFVDGSFVDNDDCVWNSCAGTSRVWRFDKNANIDTIVHVPEHGVTCATFGGKELDIMYITTLNVPGLQWMNGTEKGALYAVKLPIKGCKEDVFLGS